jgi:hypothetical protein
MVSGPARQPDHQLRNRSDRSAGNRHECHQHRFLTGEIGHPNLAAGADACALLIDEPTFAIERHFARPAVARAGIDPRQPHDRAAARALDARNRLMQEVAGFGHNALPFLSHRRERQVDLAMVEARRGWGPRNLRPVTIMWRAFTKARPTRIVAGRESQGWLWVTPPTLGGWGCGVEVSEATQRINAMATLFVPAISERIILLSERERAVAPEPEK